MAITKLYKPGQGTYTRISTAVGIGLLVAFGIFWLLEELRTAITSNTEYWLGGIAAGIVLIASALTWWILNKPKIADFMIATETEMRKVNWPTKKEILGSTWIVIAGTFLIVFILLVVDVGFFKLFESINIIQTGN